MVFPTNFYAPPESMARRKRGQFQIVIAQLADLARIGTRVRVLPGGPFFDALCASQFQLDLSSRSTLSRSRSIANGLRM
jgi:hypothetical protein